MRHTSPQPDRDPVAAHIDGEWWIPVWWAAALLETTSDHARALARAGKIRRDDRFGAILLSLRDVVQYMDTRRAWRPGGVLGGRAARPRLGLERKP